MLASVGVTALSLILPRTLWPIALDFHCPESHLIDSRGPIDSISLFAAHSALATSQPVHSDWDLDAGKRSASII